MAQAEALSQGQQDWASGLRAALPKTPKPLSVIVFGPFLVRYLLFEFSRVQWLEIPWHVGNELLYLLQLLPRLILLRQLRLPLLQAQRVQNRKPSDVLLAELCVCKILLYLP